MSLGRSLAPNELPLVAGEISTKCK